MNYKIIYDPISKKYKNIYSKSGKLILKNYINKLKNLKGGYPTQIINPELEWGLGIEKEFPILIGPYQSSMLEKVYNNFLKVFNEIFLDWHRVDIKNFIEKEINYYSNPELNIENPQTENSIKIHGITNTQPTSIENLKNEFYINLEVIPYNYLCIFNYEFLDYIINYNDDNDMFLINVPLTEKIDYINFNLRWNKLLYNLIDNDGLLFHYINSKLLKILIIQIDNFFPNIKKYIGVSKKTGEKSIYDIIRRKFNRLFNTSSYELKKEEMRFNKIFKGKKNCIITTIKFQYTPKILSYEYSRIFNLEKKMYKIEKNIDTDDFDSGGYEIRTFSKSNETPKNKTVNECIYNLTEQSFELYLSLRNILSEWEIENNIDIVYEVKYASYFLPIYNIGDDRKNEILLQQVYSGETEINLTLPYISLNKLNNSNVDFLIHNSNINKLKLLQRSQIEFENSFKSRHIYLMKTLQLLSPLFWACLTGVINFSFGDNSTVPETSKRYNSYSGYRILTKQKIDELYNSRFYYYDVEMNDDILKLLKKTGLQGKKENAFEFSVNRNSKKYVPSENKYFGFEWKVLDQYPAKYISHMCLLIFMIAQWLHNKKINIDFYNEYSNGKFSLISDIIHIKVSDIENWFNSILFQGWNSYVSKDYSKLVIDSLKFEQFDYMNTDSCYNFLNSIYSNLYQYFKAQEANDIWIIISFFPEFYQMDDKEYMNLPNINRYNYDKMMNDYQNYFPELFNKHVERINKDIDNEDYDDLQLYLKKSTKY